METIPNFRLLRRSFIVGRHADALDDHRRLGRHEPSALNDENTTNITSRNSWTTKTLPGSFGRTRSSVSRAEVSENSEVVLRSRQGAPIKSKRRPASLYSTTETRSVHRTRPISALLTINGKFLVIIFIVGDMSP